MSSKQPQSRSGPDLPMPVPRAQSGREGRDRAGGPAQPRGAGAGSDPGLGRAGPVWADHGEHAKKAAEGWSPVSPSGGGDGGARASLKAALMGISRGIKLSCQCAWHHGSLGEDALRDPSLSRLPVSTSPRVSAPTKLKDGTQMWGSHREHQQCLFLSCGASGQLRGCTAACCSADLHLQASWAQVTQGPHQPHQPPWWRGPCRVSRGRCPDTRAQHSCFRREERVCERPQRKPMAKPG